MQIFVAHDFTAPPLRNYRRPFRVLADKYRVEFKFADDIHAGEHLLDQIEELIDKSPYCLFDVSSRNHNVFLELGFARGLEKDYSLLFCPASATLSMMGFTNGFADLPADIRGLRHIKYRSEGMLRVCLDELLKDLTKTPNWGPDDQMRIAQIDELLARHPDGLLMKEIAQRFTTDLASVRGFVQKMIRDGLVEQRGSGTATRYVRIAKPKRAA